MNEASSGTMLPGVAQLEQRQSGSFHQVKSQCLCLVESNAAVGAFPAQQTADWTWLTTSPAVYEKMIGDGRDIRFLDEGIEQTEADAVGYAACDLTRWLSDRIDAGAASHDLRGLRPGRALRATLQRSLVRFLYKGFLLDRLLTNGVDRRALLVVGNPELESVNSFTLLPHRFETMFAPIAASIGVKVHAFQTPRPIFRVEKGDVHLPTMSDRLLTVINSDLSSVLFKAWSILLRGTKVRIRPGRRPLVLIDGSNELIEEMFGELLRRGYEIAKLPNVEVPFAPRSWGEQPNTEEVNSALESAARAHSIHAGEAMRAALRLALRRVYDALAWAPGMAAKAEAVANSVSKESASRPVAVLAANMHAGYPLMLMQALNSRGVHTFKPEHGSAPGQSPLQTSISRLLGSDEFTDTLYYTPAQQAEAEMMSGGTATCTVIGAPRCTKQPKCPGLQRMLMRRRLGIRGRHIVWCTGIYPNNMQMFPHYWRDGPYHHIRKSLIESCLAGLPDRVTIKLHPAARYVDGDPTVQGMRLPKNCTAIPDQDFRYLRTAADVVIVDGPGSVMGWAMGLGVPVIFVEFGMYILTLEAEKAFRGGLLFVDAREAGWQRRLRGLLEMPHRDLGAHYATMKQGRRALLEQYIFGPEGSSAKRAVDYMTARMKAA